MSEPVRAIPDDTQATSTEDASRRGGRYRFFFWTVGLPALLTVCCAAWTVKVLLDARAEPSDPVVETVPRGNGVYLHTATFAPRVRLSPDLRYRHTFLLENETSQALTVVAKSKSCGCLSAEINREVIRPGESAAVTLEDKPSDLVSKQTTMTVATDDGVKRMFQLRTTTYPPVMLDNGRELPISFGALAPGVRIVGKHSLTVHSEAGTPPPKLRWVPGPQAGGVECRLIERGIEPFADGRLQRRRYDLEVAVEAGTVPGLVMKKIAFGATEGEGREAYHFATPVTWTVRSPVTLEPPRWILRENERRTPDSLRTRFVVADEQSRPLRVLSSECSHACLSVAPVPGGEASRSEIEYECEYEYEVTLDLASLPPEKAFVGTVTLRIEVIGADPPISVVESFKVVALPSSGPSSPPQVEGE